MEAISAKLQEAWSSKGSPRLVAFALYEDAVTSARVEEFCHRVVRELAPGQLIKRAWLCSELRLPRLRTIAVSEAASADIVVLAVHHGEQLAPEVVSWFNDLLQRDAHPSIVFALFDGARAGDSTSIRTELLEITSPAGIELVTFLEEKPDDELA